MLILSRSWLSTITPGLQGALEIVKDIEQALKATYLHLPAGEEEEGHMYSKWALTARIPGEEGDVSYVSPDASQDKNSTI